MDYQSVIVQNIQARKNTIKGDQGKFQNNERSIKSEKSDISEKSTIQTLKNQPKKKIFNIVTAKPPNHIEDRPTRKTRGTYKKNTAIHAIKEEFEDGEEYFNDDDGFEIESDEKEDSLFDDEDDDDEDFDEMIPTKKGKRKAKESKRKPQGSKKVKKNENKELLAVNRNTIQYHLFN